MQRGSVPLQRPLHRALYLQVHDALAERIALGVWKPGMAIANESDLARELGVSAGTVRKALELMEAQRLVTRRQGRGTFVSDQTSNEQTARFCNIRAADGEHVNGRVVSVEVSEGAADDQERLRLRLADGDAVYRIHRVWRHGDQNFLVAEASVSAARFPGLASKTKAAGNIGALAREYGILLGRHEVRIALGVPPARTAQTLGIAPGTTVMRFERTVFMLDGWPVEHATSHCHLAGSYYQIESG